MADSEMESDEASKDMLRLYKENLAKKKSEKMNECESTSEESEWDAEEEVKEFNEKISKAIKVKSDLLSWNRDVRYRFANKCQYTNSVAKKIVYDWRSMLKAPLDQAERDWLDWDIDETRPDNSECSENVNELLQKDDDTFEKEITKDEKNKYHVNEAFNDKDNEGSVKEIVKDKAKENEDSAVEEIVKDDDKIDNLNVEEKENEDCVEEIVKDEDEIDNLNVEDLRKKFKVLQEENKQLKSCLAEKQEDLRKTKRDNQNKKTYKYSCPFCKYEGLNIKRHVNNKHKGKESIFNEARQRKPNLLVRLCSLCKKYFKRVDVHLKQKHKDIEVYSPTFRNILRKAHIDYIKRKQDYVNYDRSFLLNNSDSLTEKESEESTGDYTGKSESEDENKGRMKESFSKNTKDKQNRKRKSEKECGVEDGNYYTGRKKKQKDSQTLKRIKKQKESDYTVSGSETDTTEKLVIRCKKKKRKVGNRRHDISDNKETKTRKRRIEQFESSSEDERRINRKKTKQKSRVHKKKTESKEAGDEYREIRKKRLKKIGDEHKEIREKKLKINDEDQENRRSKIDTSEKLRIQCKKKKQQQLGDHKREERNRRHDISTRVEQCKSSSEDEQTINRKNKTKQKNSVQEKKTELKEASEDEEIRKKTSVEDKVITRKLKETGDETPEGKYQSEQNETNEICREFPGKSCEKTILSPDFRDNVEGTNEENSSGSVYSYSSSDNDEISDIPDTSWSSPVTKADTTLQVLLKGFYLHCTLPEGGHVAPKMAIQHSQRSFVIIDTIDPEKHSVLSITEESIVWTDFVQVFMNKPKEKGGLTARTLKTYLFSLEKFVDYILINEGLKEHHKDRFSKLIKKLRLYRSALRHNCQLQKHKKFHNDREQMPSVDDIRKVLTCEFTRNIQSQLDRARVDQDFAISTFSVDCIRDYLLTRITLENICRPGILENMSLHTLNTASFDKQTNRWSLVVFKHKTFMKHGPSHPSLTETTYKYLKTYIQVIRPLHVSDSEKKDEERPAFVTKRGNWMDSSYIGNRIKEYGKRCGAETIFSPTLIRKTSSTMASSAEYIEQQTHAILLEHDLRTEQKFYVMHNKPILQASAAARNQERLGITDLLTPQDVAALPQTNGLLALPAPSNLPTRNQQQSVVAVSQSNNLLALPAPTNEDQSPLGTPNSTSVLQNTTSSLLAADSPDSKSGRPVTFSECASNCISNNFSTFVDLGTIPTRAEINMIKSNHEILQEYSVKQIQNRVRYLIKKNPALLPQEIDKDDHVREWVKDCTLSEPSTTSVNTRYKWADGDVKVIRSYFQKLLKRPKIRPKILQIRAYYISKDAPSTIKEIYEREDTAEWRKKCEDKVRTEWCRDNTKR